jgi:hypothetical protein
VKANPKSPCLGVRKLLADGKTRGEYVWETYTSIFNRVRDLASGLKSFDYPRVRSNFQSFDLLIPAIPRFYAFKIGDQSIHKSIVIISGGVYLYLHGFT